MKNPLTPAGIEPATFRFVAQHLNHCATAVPKQLLGDVKNEKILENKRRSVRLYSVENSLWNSLWTCHQTENDRMRVEMFQKILLPADIKYSFGVLSNDITSVPCIVKFG